VSKAPSWRQIAVDFDAEVSYLIRRLLLAEGRDPSPEERAVVLAEMEKVIRQPSCTA